MSLAQAVRYPFQGQGWFGRILLLALLQLIPIVGLLILLGYGLGVVRAVYADETDLPRLYWGRTLSDGVRLLLAGLIYLIPILIAIPLILVTGTETEGGAAGLATIATPIVMMLILTVLGGIAKQKPKLKPVITVISGVFLIGFIATIIMRLRDVQTSVSSATLADGVSLNPIGMVLIVVLLLLALFVFVAVLVVGVRYAVTGTGLLKPNETIKLMVSDRAAFVRLIITVILFEIVAAMLVGVGSVLLIMPGLFVLVCCALVLWHFVAQFGMEIGIRPKTEERA